MRRRVVLGTLAAAAAVFLSSWPIVFGQVDQPHVVMISIDGLRPALLRDGRLAAPTLTRLAASGVYAAGVIGVFPTVTYPSHTTLITGVPPAEHGIYNNHPFDPEDGAESAWYWY